jgi:hypothetical protein
MTPRGTLVSSRRRTAVVLAVAALALSACGNNPAGAASVVGGVAITDTEVATSVSDVQAQVAQVKGAAGASDATVTAAVVQNMTRHLLLDEAATREGIVVTPTEVDTFLATIVSGQFNGDHKALEQALAAQNHIPAGQINDAARDNLVLNALVAKIYTGTDTAAQSKALLDYMDKLGADIGVAVSPRFGTWKDFTLGPVPDDLSTLAPLGVAGNPSSAPSPSPTPSPSAS